MRQSVLLWLLRVAAAVALPADQVAKPPPEVPAPLQRRDGWAVDQGDGHEVRPDLLMTAVHPSPDAMLVFWISSEGGPQINLQSFQPNVGWKLVYHAVGEVTSGLSAVSRWNNYVEVFWAQDGGVVSNFYNNGDDWGLVKQANCGSPGAGSALSAISRDPGTMDLFYVTVEGVVEVCHFHETDPPNGEWKKFVVASAEEAHYPKGASLAAVAHGTSSAQVFWIAPGGDVHERHLSAEVGGGMFFEGGPIFPDGNGKAAENSQLAVVSRTDEHVDVFWIGADGSIQQASWAQGWSKTPNIIASPGTAQPGGITAISRGPVELEIFFTTADGVWKHGYWNGDTWGYDELAPAGSVTPGSSIAATARNSGSAEAWCRSADGSKVVHAYWNGDNPTPQTDSGLGDITDRLPVGLGDLFPEDPGQVDFVAGVKASSSWDLGQELADTNFQGGAGADLNNSTFGFHVITSPHNIQTNLRRRDGAPWELFNCYSNGTGTHTVQAFCIDGTEDDADGCGQIRLGKGVPGTIIEMPDGCGPSRYAVALDMVGAHDQKLPAHLAKRYTHAPQVYDLSFDYNFHRVPRDNGEVSKLRIDFSNHPGYWESFVAAAAAHPSKKTKRSFDHGADPREWLEAEWRDDLHFGALSTEDLHKRWFGSDWLEWLKNLVRVLSEPSVTHTIDESLTVKIVDDKAACKRNNADLNAFLRATARASVNVETTFGMTIIANMHSFQIDLSQSYVYVQNKGKIEAVFTLEGMATAEWVSDEFTTPPILFPGASYAIPGVVTIGPNLKVAAQLKAEVGFAGKFESKVQLAQWDVRQTYPNQAGPEYDPLEQGKPSTDGSQQSLQPTFDYSVTAWGSVTAHVMPKLAFGLDFDPRWNVGQCSVELVADAYVTLHADAEAATDSTTCPFKYGIDAGADLYVSVHAPNVAGWDLGIPKLDLANLGPFPLVAGDTCPQQGHVDARRSIGSFEEPSAGHQKRGDHVFGPLFQTGLGDKLCPGPVNGKQGLCDPNSGFNFAEITVTKKKKSTKVCEDKLQESNSMTVESPNYKGPSDAKYRYPIFWAGPDPPCNAMDFRLMSQAERNTGPWRGTAGKALNLETEHILEFKMLGSFLESIRTASPSPPYTDRETGQEVDFCAWFRKWWFNSNLIAQVGQQYPGSNVNTEEMIIVIGFVNGIKANMWSDTQEIRAESTMVQYMTGKEEENGKEGSGYVALLNVIKNTLWALKYHTMTWGADHEQRGVEWALVRAVGRVKAKFEEIETNTLPNIGNTQTYTSQNFAGQWIAFMNKRAAEAKAKAEAFVERWLPELENLAAQDPVPEGVDPDVVRLLVDLKNRVIGGPEAWNPPTFT